MKRFFWYGVAGIMLEIGWTGLGSILRQDWRLTGVTYLWMFPIYGSAVWLEPLHEGIRGLPWWVRGVIWVGVIWVVEGLTGSLLREVTGVIPWDYSGSTRWTIEGLIRLDYAPAWFGVGLLFERLHDWLTAVEA
jgi:hypothetical protein